MQDVVTMAPPPVGLHSMNNDDTTEDTLVDALLRQIRAPLYGDRQYRNATMHAKMCAARTLRLVLEEALVGVQDPTEILPQLQRRGAKHYFQEAIDSLKSVSSGVALDDHGYVFSLREDLGVCTSLLGWWYGRVAHEDADALAELIAWRHPPELGMLGCLDRSLLPQVCPKVAERWGKAEEYNIVYA